MSDKKLEVALKEIGELKAALKLKQSETASNRLAAIVNSSDDAIISKDLNSIVTTWNKGAEKIFGYTSTEMVGTSIMRLIPADRQDEENQILTKIKRGENLEHFETQRQTKDGRLIDVSVTASPIKDAGGKIVGASKVARDISERKNAEEVLRKVSRQETGRKNVRVLWELVVIFGLAALSIAVSAYTDAFTAPLEKLVFKFKDNIDDLFVPPTILLLGFLIFSYRRWKDAQSKVSEQANIQEALRILHGELEKRIQQRTAELTKANAALQEREGQLRLYVEHSPAAIAMFDRDMKYLVAGRRWTESYRVVGQSIIGRSHYEVFPEISQRWKEIHRRCLAGAVEKNEEEPFLRADGKTDWIRWEVHPWHQADGKIGGITIFSEDITARKQAEEARQKSEARYHTLFDYAPDGIVIVDAKGYYLDANASICRMLGYTRDEFIGLNATDIVAPVEIPHIGQALDVIKNKSDYHREWQFRRKDGSVFAVDTIATAMPDGNLLAMIRDITERKRAEESLQLLGSAVKQSKESIVITDAELDLPGPKTIFVNPAFTQMTGYTAEEVIGKTPRILQGPRTDKAVLRRLREKLERGEVFEGEAINYRKDGKEFDLEWQITPLRNASGKITHFVATQHDITARKKLEAQFRQSQKMEGIGQLAGGVAHDFNNILAVIQMQSELLKSSGSLSAEQSEFADEIGVTVQRAAALTRQLLLFSRREVFQPRDLDLSESVTSTTKMLRRILGENIQVQLKLASQPIFIHADAAMMDQVLLNLAVNARDAMPNGGQLVIETSGVEFDEFAVTQSPQARPGSFVCLNVSDSGCGIPPEILPKIFEPFFTTKDVGKGTRLGLATVFGIVQQHQGWINVYSEVNHGTTFRVYLPRLAKNGGKKSSQPALTTTNGGNETILLAEDDPSLRISVRKALSQLGYRILEAPTGVKALEVWKENRDEIRLLLTDLVMPDGMTGKDLAHRILQENPKLKVIYMSGYSAEVVGKDFPLKEGVNFLTKPFQASKLAQTIRDSLDKTA